MEIVCHQGDHALISGCCVVLLKCLQHHHFRPPILAITLLGTCDLFISVRQGSWTEVSVGTLITNAPFDPCLYFGFQFLIIQHVSQWYKSINPIGSAFPAIARSTKPSIIGSAYQAIDTV